MHRIEPHEPESWWRRPSPRAAAAILGVLVSVSSIALATQGWFGGSSIDPAPGAARDQPFEPEVTTIDIGHGGGIDVEIGEGGVWVTTRDAVLEVDPATDRVVKEIPIEAPFLLGVGEGSVWVTESIRGTLIRIDPETGKVVATNEIPTGAYDVDVAAGVVWVTAGGSHGGRLVRIDPLTNEIAASIHIGRGTGPGGLGTLAAGSTAVWVTRGGEHDSLVRIEPNTNRIAAVVDIANPHYWNDLALGDGSLWVVIGPTVRLDDDTRTIAVRLLRIDPETNDVSPRLPIGHGQFGIGAGDDSIWVYAGSTGGLTQVDAATRAILQRVEIPDGGSSWGGDPGIDVANGVVWMAGATSLLRIDPDPKQS